jgi:YesN/AraC family two-component response regulator
MDINIVKLKKYAEKCSVLYVEDDELIREQTASFLGRFFSDIVLAEDGAIGLSKYEQRDFDIVITDIDMPNMNGIEMIEAIKKQNYEQIILTTSANKDSEYLMKLINLHVMRFILKPFNNKQFLYIIYKIAEELYQNKEKLELGNEINKLTLMSQAIVDHINLGIIVFEKNKVSMANEAFLKIGGFDSYDTLILEMPEIGVLFEESSGCINCDTNYEFIHQLKILKEEERIVRIINNLQTYEYQVSLSVLSEEDDSYILTFNDITAIHDSLYLDEHTQLPMRKFIMEELETLKQSRSKITIFIMSIKNFSNIEKWYGKADSISAEIEFAQSIKSIKKRMMPEAFVGYFGQNNFLLIPTKENIQEFAKALQEIKISSIKLLDRHKNSEIEFNLIANVKVEYLETNKSMLELETDVVNAFDTLV